jgi:hypothetical protein
MSDCFRGRRATRRPLDTQPHGRRGRHRRQDRLHRDAALEASDLTLVRGDLIVAADAVRLSRRTLRIIRSNLCWAFAHDVAALPLAAPGMLNPMIPGAAMAFSSVFVVPTACGCAASPASLDSRTTMPPVRHHDGYRRRREIARA